MRFINKSCPILLLPLWWIFWLLHFIFFNSYSFITNQYLKIKGEKRDPQEEKPKKKKKQKQRYEKEPLAEKEQGERKNE